MSSKMPRFLMTSIASIVLTACGVETMEGIPEPPVEAIESAESEEEAISSEKVEELETTEAESETPPVPVEESGLTEEEKTGANEAQKNNRERAFNQLLAETHLEREAYDYYFAEMDTEDFVEIEVREIREDAAHATLEGVYRYYLETEEIFMRDYLTGDFIPYTPTE